MLLDRVEQEMIDRGLQRTEAMLHLIDLKLLNMCIHGSYGCGFGDALCQLVQEVMRVSQLHAMIKTATEVNADPDTINEFEILGGCKHGLLW